MIKDGSLGLLAHLGKPYDILALMEYLSYKSYDGSFVC
jgi:hypothetical protein